MVATTIIVTSLTLPPARCSHCHNISGCLGTVILSVAVITAPSSPSILGTSLSPHPSALSSLWVALLKSRSEVCSSHTYFSLRSVIPHMRSLLDIRANNLPFQSGVVHQHNSIKAPLWAFLLTMCQSIPEALLYSIVTVRNELLLVKLLACLMA